MAVGPGTNPGFARKLASSDKGTREKAVVLFVHWLSSQAELEEDELRKIWKGLFYCVWHSDKAPVQSELIERLAGLLESVAVELSVSFFSVFLTTMRREWSGIDRLRLDKFYLLLRKFLSHMFKVLENGGWDKGLVSKFMDALKERAFLARDRHPALGVNLHFTDIFWDEFGKFLPVPDGTLELLLEPFYSILATSSDRALLKRVRENIFNVLLADARSLISKVEKEENLDGTVGSIGYLLNSTSVAPRLFDLASAPSTTMFNRKVLYELNEEFGKVAKSFDSLKITAYVQMNATREPWTKSSTAEKTDNLSGTRVEDTDGGSRTRLRKRQAKGMAPGAKLPDAKAKKSKKLKIEKAPENGISEDTQKATTTVGLAADHSQVDGKEEKEGQERVVKKKRSYEASLLTARTTSLPLLQKISLQKKAKKRKKGQPKPAHVASGDNRVDTLLEPGADRSGRMLGTNGHQGGSSQAPIGDSDCSANGHQDINDVTMNLAKKFDFVAADEPAQSRTNGSPMSDTTVGSPAKLRSRRKLKKDTAAFQSASLSSDVSNGAESLPVSSQSTAEGDGDVRTPLESSAKKKKVRFVLRNNLICKPHAPLPPLSVRTPPSATPRGSALKSGVLPGPIRTRPIRVARGNSLTKSRKRASRQLLTMSMQKPKSSTRKLRKRTSL